MTMRNLGNHVGPSILAALMIMWDNALTAQSRLILLDSPLIFFTSFTIFAWSKFFSLSSKPFTTEWTVWLMLTGLGLGTAVSSKWVGLFTIAMIGVATLKSLYDVYSDKDVSMADFGKHFACRAVGLIFIPVAFYVFMFFLHFHILRNTGTGTGFISPEMASTLKGSTTIQETVDDVAYNSKVFIRHVRTTGGYLHSHVQTYPTGSKQQQVTLYPYGDENSWWLVEAVDGDVPQNETRLIKNGDKIRLLHIPTGKHLHSHDHRPPVSDRDYQDEVSGYGNANHSDSNDFWIVEIKSGKGEAGERLQTFQSLFALKHPNRGCHLFSHNVKLPKWGFEQQEVTCGRGVLKKNTLWRIEANEHPVLSTLPEHRIKIRKLGFLEKVIQLQKVMFNVNNGLISSHPFDSRPTSWPTLQRGISFWASKDDSGGPKKSIYLIGNPLVWKTCLIGILTTPLIILLRALVLQRGSNLAGLGSSLWVKRTDALALLWIGWFLHWAPFFIMDRQLFLHHYLPALYISALLTGTVLDSIPMPRQGLNVLCALLAIMIWRTFVAYAPITYGYPWAKEVCEKSKSLKTWDWECK
jgi:dolichyl-phosphate-mannose-protein mannosyltransferase